MRLNVLSVAVFTATWATMSPVAGGSQPLAPPAPGCVALPLPSVAGIDNTATNYAAAVRDLFASFLTGPSTKIVKLEARLSSQAADEAKAQDCGLILVATVTRKHSGGPGVGSLLGRAAGIAAVRTPVGSGVTGTIASSATSAVGEAVYSLAAQTRAKDEIELTYRLAPPDAIERAAPVSAKAKAKANGEDLLTPLVEQAANSIVQMAASEKKE